VTSVDRRKFLRAAGVTAVGAAAAGVGGELLLGKHPSANAAAQMPAAPGRPQATGQAPRATAAPPKLEIEPMKPLPPGAELNVAGVSPFYTPNKEFYRVDTSLVMPKVPAASWRLRIHGMVDRPVTLSYEDLIRRPMINKDITLACVSEAVGGNFIGNARWQGTLLAPILRKAGIKAGADQIVMRDAGGMTIGVATDPVLDGRDALLAVGMNGQVLPQAHGYPVRVVVPGLYGYVSATKWVVDMELTTFGAFSAYWVKQRPAWSQQAPIKTESRIDVPKRRSTVTAGRVTIAGVAWAQHTGVEAVEVGIDGVFYEAKLPVQDTIDTWRQWYYVWDATPGQHTLQVRATDKSGYTQTAIKHRTDPNGATGYHTIVVNVA
jgi:DMSO/TMAO reductase YedYZ molybdopterin-dependent catalytic subunit